MNFRIIEIGGEHPDVLLHRDRDEHGSEMVRIIAIGTVESQDNMFADECVTFCNSEAAQLFIKDFSLVSAIKWCIRNGITN